MVSTTHNLPQNMGGGVDTNVLNFSLSKPTNWKFKFCVTDICAHSPFIAWLAAWRPGFKILFYHFLWPHISASIWATCNHKANTVYYSIIMCPFGTDIILWKHFLLSFCNLTYIFGVNNLKLILNSSGMNLKLIWK